MIPTLEWTARKFREFNDRFFESSLKIPSFALTTTRSFLGQCSWKCIPGTCRRVYNGSRTVRVADVRPGSIILKMSKFYDRPEKELEQILIHEMIHVKFVQDNHPEVHHGPAFMRECQRINLESRGYYVITHYDTITNKVLSDEVNRKTLHVYFLKDAKGRLAYATSLTPQLTRLKESLPFWVGRFEIIGECISSHDMLQGRTPTIATYGTKCSGKWMTQAQYEDLWKSGTSKKAYAVAT